MKKLKYLLITIVLFVSIVLTTHFSEVVARAPEANAPGLGSAGNYSVLGNSTVTNSGPTTLSGSIGVWSGSSITDLAEITVGGTTNLGDSVAATSSSRRKRCCWQSFRTSQHRGVFRCSGFSYSPPRCL